MKNVSIFALAYRRRIRLSHLAKTKAVTAMDASVRDVDAGAHLAAEAGAALNGIVQSAGDVSTGIDAIGDAARRMEESAGGLQRIIDDVARVAGDLAGLAAGMAAASERAARSASVAAASSEQPAAATEEASAGVQEISAQIGELASMAGGLSGLSTEMSAFLARFGTLAHDARDTTYRAARCASRPGARRPAGPGPTARAGARIAACAASRRNTSTSSTATRAAPRSSAKPFAAWPSAP